MESTGHHAWHRRPKVQWAIAGVLLLAHAILAGSAALPTVKSLSYDELFTLTAGSTIWQRGDFRFHSENGQGYQRVVTLLANLWVPPRLPPIDDPDYQAARIDPTWTKTFFTPDNPLNTQLLLARLSNIAISLGLCLAVWYFASRAFGAGPGLVALGICCLSPTVLGHARWVTTDIATALGFVLATAGIWRAMHVVSLGSMTLAGLGIGMLVVTKHSSPLLVPIAGLMWIAWLIGGRGLRYAWPNGRRGRVRSRWGGSSLIFVNALGATALVVAVVWANAGFRYAAWPEQPEADRRFSRINSFEQGLSKIPPWQAGLIRAVSDARLLPEQHLAGVAGLLATSDGRASYLMGEYIVFGDWKYFPVAFAVKSSLVVLGLTALGVWRATRCRRWRAWYRAVPWIAMIAVTLAAAMSASINIGHRHLMPVYAGMFILLAGSFVPFGRSQRALAGLALVLMLGQAVWIWPHYTTFFNAAAGGPARGHHWLSDSNIDWGHDLPALANARARVVASGDPRPWHIAYWGTDQPERYIDDHVLLQNLALKPKFDEGWYAVSRQMLLGLSGLPGPWNPAYEVRYQQLRQRILPHLREDEAVSAARLRAAGVSVDQLWEFHEMRMGRLFAYLRHQPVDGWAGWSIMLFRMDQAELDAAVNGPPIMEAPQPWLETKDKRVRPMVPLR